MQPNVRVAEAPGRQLLPDPAVPGELQQRQGHQPGHRGRRHVEPFGGYSRKYKSLAELPDGATVAILNEGSNSGRALLLLQKAGLLKLKDPEQRPGHAQGDIAENPKNLKFRNSNRPCCRAWTRSTWTLSAPTTRWRPSSTRTRWSEDRDSPYVNYLVARPDNRTATP